MDASYERRLWFKNQSDQEKAQRRIRGIQSRRFPQSSRGWKAAHTEKNTDVREANRKLSTFEP